MVDSKFSFNNLYYQQKFGLGIGNPLSPFLSNLYMEFLEKYLLIKIKDQKIIWFRYIDHVICCWPTFLCLVEFLRELHCLVTSIEFTYEIEVDNKLPFMDVLIHRVNNTHFKYQIYREETSNNSFIHYYSGHNYSIKNPFLFTRGLRVCSLEYFDEEITFIFNIANKSKYPKHFIDICFTKAIIKHL